MANRIQLRRGGAQEWANANPTLAQGELGIELDTGRFKIGDGVSAWNTLRYERPVESTSNTANTLVQRDTDGNFSAGTITATLIGNASTAARLASTRQIQLSQDITASGVFDGSANLNLNAELTLVSTLPHYDGTGTPTATYTSVTVDAKGRIINASNPSTLADYNLNGTVEGQSAQPYDLDLVAISGLTTTGIISRTSGGSMATRTITGTATRIAINDGAGLSGNPTIDLIVTAVTPGDYNTESLTSVSGVGGNSEPFGTETVNATKFTVDAYGRLTSATNVPIATATEGSKYPNYDAGTAYSRYAIIQNASKVYQAIADISAGAGAPTHSSGDSGSWRYLAAEATEQKGLASFAQEDFDVDANGHVTIAAAGVDNTQLQNNRIIFTDGNTVDEFELDNELTTSTAHTGFDYLNYIKINDTSGNLLFGANNTGDSGAGEIDVNVRSYFSDPDITLDGAVAQTLDKTGDGNLTFQLTQNSASARNLSILSTNAGSGTSTVTITAEDVVDIDASDANGKVHVENARFQANYIATTDATMNLDPGDDRAVTGLVRVWGDLQVDGVTTTVNSTTMTVDDVVLTLGGDTAPASDDNLDRGVEFRYYDTQARLGFYGWDTNYTDLGGHEGGYRFLHAATNTSETFAGTDSGIIAGNVKLTTNTNSTSNTTGDLVVAGGAGIGQDVNIGGLLDVDGTFRANSTSRFDDTMVLRGASKSLQFQNGAGTVKSEIHTTSGNAEFGGIVTVTGATDLNSTLNVASTVNFEDTDEPTVLLSGSTGLYEIQSSDYGSFKFDGGGYVEGDTVFNSDIYLNGQFNQKEDATANYGLRNYLAVRYKMRTGTTAAYTPSYSNHDTSNLRVFGGAGINTTLHVGGTGSGEGLFVGKENSGDTVKFSVLGASGNTDIEGTLNVEGQVTIQDSVIINAANEEFAIQNGSAVDKFTVDTDNGNTLIEGTLNVNGVTDIDADFAVRNGTTDKFTVASATGNTVIEGTLNGKGAADFDSTLNVDGNTTLGGTLTVTGASEFNNTVDVDNNFAVRTSGGVDKFTVASASGNTVTQGTLTVEGETNINETLNVSANGEFFRVRNGNNALQFTVDTDNGNTNVYGTLTVSDATQINDTLGVTGVTSITNSTGQTLTGSYGADGAVRITGGVGVGENLAVGGNMRVYGDFEITGSTTQSGNTGFSGRVSITNTQDVTSFGDNNVSLTTDGGLRVSKNAYVGGDFVVYDDANSRNAFIVDVSTGDATLHNTLTVGGNLVVNGTTTTVNSTVTTLDDPIITLGGDTAPASNDGKDRGVEFRYYDGSAKVGFFGYDRSSDQYTFLVDATNTAEVHSGTDAAVRAGSLRLTSAGTALDVDNNANIDGTLTVDGQIISNVATGSAPFTVASTTKVLNLNADLLDGMTTASAATGSTVVNRDSSGDFAANVITMATSTITGAATVGTTLGVTGAATLSSTLGVTGATTLSSTLGVTGVTTLTGLLNANGGIAVDTNNFTVDGTTGAVVTASTLSVGSTSSFTGAITATGGVVGNVTGNLVAAISTGKTFNPETDSTYNLGASTLRWATAYLDSLNAGTSITTAGTLSVTGTSTFTGEISANGGIALQDTDKATFGDDDDMEIYWSGTQNRIDTEGPFQIRNSNTSSGISFYDGDNTNFMFKALPLGAIELYHSGVKTFETTATGATLTGVLVATSLTGNVTGNVTGTVSSIANHDTDALSEGSSNLYYTDERVDDRVNALIVAGTGITKAYNDVAGTYTLTVTQADIDTDNVTEGSTNLFTTAARTRTHFTYGTGIEHDGSGTLSVTQADIDTDNVTEGSTNLFTTAARTRTHFTYGTGIELSGAGELSVTQADINTDNITEGGTNIFFTNARADARFDTKIAAADTDDLSEGSTNLYFTEARADARVDAGFTAKSTSDLSEGTNQYYTEARVQTKLDNAFAQLQAMLNNLATTTTLTLNLSGDPTPGAVVAVGVSDGGGGGFTAGTAVATSGGTGSSLTVDTTVVGGVITAASVNAGGSDYLISDTVTVTNPNAGKVLSLNLASLAGGSNYVTGTALATTGGSGSASLTVDITAVAGAITNVTINDGGTGYVAGETITIVQPTGADGSNPATGGTVDIATVATNATLTLTDITTMEVGATVTGATSGTTGVITALGTNQITVDTVSGFFKVGEVVSANDVTTLTISSFA
ncbi:structural protein [Synechococcus phage S-IOM18]|uniref:Structural protein n=1 Tax=Synechococcus phage S-IOM18 TaxID=754039 RepID=R9TQ12_9CAUD|nr:structural protein [Synechococcus phage S-IOM18]AGN33584.1 structural protein [Synechococcus phage S-IOM18]